MPIVFVHGVNNRNGGDYSENEATRNGFLREIVAPALGLNPQEVYLDSPYWGDHGAKFAWDMRVLPLASTQVERFGAEDFTANLGFTPGIDAKGEAYASLSDLARKNFGEAVEVLFASAMADIKDESEAREVAILYCLAEAYVAKNPTPDWVAGTDDTAFADLLHYKIKGAQAPGVQSMGAGGLLDRLKEGMSRLGHAIPDAGSDLLLRATRKGLNANVTRFAGDGFVYFANRTKPDGSPGPIIEIVLAALRQAKEKVTQKDPHLIIIAHSFGGEITYDILTHFAPDLKVDYLVTVGSQVGLFEEMKLLCISKQDLPPDPPTGKVLKPTNIVKWLNVFDTNDPFSYLVEPIFADTHDYLYDTGYEVTQAHGGYFLRPSFYTRLADRLRR